MAHSNMISAIHFFCALVGLGMSAAYGVTFFLTSYNEIYFSGQSGYDDTDLPFTLAIVECVITASVFIIGSLAFPTDRVPSRNAVLCAAFLFAGGSILQGVFGVVRGTHLGLIGSDITRTCSDTALSGCPTTRYENVRSRDIMFSSPYGGQCTFWFWQPGMKALYESAEEKGEITLCGGWSKNSPTICRQTVEKHMDWSKASSYGWRDNPSEITALLSDTTGGVTIGKEHNMEQLMILQSTVIGTAENTTNQDWASVSVSANDNNIPSEYRYASQPSIAYCWYWGCSEICQSHRFWVNRWWFFSSFVACGFHVINFILTLRVIPSKKKSEDASVVEGVPLAVLEDGVNQPSLKPELLNSMKMNAGRRRRLQNPSGLLF